jgi:hypothetical protein
MAENIEAISSALLAQLRQLIESTANSFIMRQSFPVAVTIAT